MTCSSSVGLIILCNIMSRHSSKISSEDKLSVVILMYRGDMVGRTGDASPVSPAVATPLTRTMDLPQLTLEEFWIKFCTLAYNIAGFFTYTISRAVTTVGYNVAKLVGATSSGAF